MATYVVDMKVAMPRMLSEDTTDATQTPRSAGQSNSEGFTDDGQSPKNSSRAGSLGGSKSGDELLEDDQHSGSDPEDDDGDDAYSHDDYYAFLREMAGSFEATREDDESEVSSDSEGSSDEDESQPIGRKRSSTIDDKLPDNGLQLSPPFVGRGRAHGLGSPEAQEEFSKVSGSLAGKSTFAQPSRVGYPPNMAMRYGGPQQGRQWPPAPSPLCIAACQGANSSDAFRKRPVPLATPSSDTRPPVVDDYDVTKATREYAEQRLPLSRFDRDREDLQEAIRLRQDQAEKLLAMSRKKHLDPEQRSHYARVRLELVAEANAVEEQLQTLLEAHEKCNQVCSCAATMGHQETAFEGSGSVPPDVVVA